MGVLKLFSESSYDGGSQMPNPNPRNFIILETETVGSFLVLKVRYPDCTNYEGTKILVYEGVTRADLVEQGSIDPHFSENPNFASPVARFVPTTEGWDMALEFAEVMHKLRQREKRRKQLKRV